jgi:hypothetical protein
VSGFHNFVFAQEFNSADSISKILSDEGFENVRTKIIGSDLMVAFENRRYRSQARGLAAALKTISHTGYFGKDFKINIVLLHQEVPMVLVTLKFDDYQNFINDVEGTIGFDESVGISFDYEGIWEKISSGVQLNNSNYKSDFVVIPQFRAQFGKFTHPVESNINLIPEYNVSVSRGLSIKAQMIIPVFNELDKESNVLRPGIISVNQFIRLKDDVFFAATAGFFDKNRAGGNFEMKKYFDNGRFSFGADVGYTTDYTYTGINTEYLVDQNFLTALLVCEYRYEPYDLTGRLQAGNFLFNQLGVRFDLSRQFGEVNIGFFAIATESDVNGGFNFAIPLPPRKYSKPKYLRIRPVDKFSWEYRAKGLITSGTMYNTEYDLFNLMSEFNPDYIKRNFLLEIKKYN